jgi:TrmH family RNA methyltransferase
LVNNLARLGADVEIVSEEVMKHCSDTETPQGLMVALPFPEVMAPESLTLAVVLDKLRDPGNMGALLRTALAAGVECVFLTHGTVDPFNPKVVRAAMGAHLHLPIQYVKDEELSAHLKKLDLWVAEMRAGQAYDEIDWTQPVAVAIGNEAYGTDDELRRLAKGFVHIPMRAESESLNAATAAAIILFEINRWRERR